jgi:hypothetical protein
MKISCCITALVLFAATVFARIGETEAQIEKRYGKPTSSFGSTKAYLHRDFFIIVTFDNGVSGIETYEKRNRGAISALNIRKLLDANGGGNKWHKSNRTDFEFQYTQKTRFAEYNRVTNTLTIAEYEALSRINARNQSLNAPSEVLGNHR